MAKRKIRNLRSIKQELTNKRSSCCTFMIKIHAAFLGCILGIVFYNSQGDTISRLHKLVNEQYYYYIYGKIDYCNQSFQSSILTVPLINNLLNQQNALHEIIDEIENFKNVTSIAFVGGSGVGKTLTCNILQANFQWPSNVFYYVWPLSNVPVSISHHILNSIKKTSSMCGINLAIIDNVNIKDANVIVQLNYEILKYFNDNNLQAIVIYVFNLATYSSEDLQLLDESRLFLENLQGIKTINFRSFDRNDIQRCIDFESFKLNVILKNDDKEELLDYIESSKTGCKLIRSKLVMYT